MGAYSPAPVVTADVHHRAMREIILPTIRGMEKDGIPYTGFLYAGLMIDKAGHPKTLEFNCRMGDPETQPIMMRLKSDLVDVMLAATEVKLDQLELQWDRRTALAWSWLLPAIPKIRARAMSSRACPPQPTMPWSSMPVRSWAMTASL